MIERKRSGGAGAQGMRKRGVWEEERAPASGLFVGEHVDWAEGPERRGPPVKESRAGG